ncbi:sialate O-acetylesterase [Paludibacter sp.]
MKIKSLISFLFVLVFIQLKAQLSLPAFFTDNMVLQQKTIVPVWGKAKPGQKVTVLSSWDNNKQIVMTDNFGNWKVDFKTPLAGGPYTITISTDRKNIKKLENVMIGEVWLCSGQSNMEWRVKNDIKDMHKEIAEANYPNIRMIKIQNQTSFRPEYDCKVEGNGWLVCSPENVGEFSAVGYFFGREIYKSQNVPVGLINSSWGGTLAEVWVDGETLEQMPYFAEYVKNLRQLPEDANELEKIYQTNVSNWLLSLNEKDKAYENGKLIWANPDFSDVSWTDFEVPGMIQDRGLTQKNGIFWFRKEVEIPESWTGSELTLNLGNIDDNDFTYFNGNLVGKTEGWLHGRSYKTSAKLVKKGKAIIAVRVFDTGGLGGFGGKKESIYIESAKGKINLSGNWKVFFSLPLSEMGMIPRRYTGDMNVPTALYNAMINPLTNYAIKGAIWYQGESNVGRAYQYRDLMPLLINGWRNKFGYNFPFYMVQLANFMDVQNEPVESTWAELREAQLKTLQLENTGMAVIIDIGEARDIHPRNKQDVGYRLALAARANTYNEMIPYSGPIYKSYKIESNTIKISFDHVYGGLKTIDGDKVKGFAIAGVDHKFYWADAEIQGNEIVVSSPHVNFPVAVRYAWADNPVCNLYNSENLPASPFRTDDWRGITE